MSTLTQKKVIADFPAPLFERTVAAEKELGLSRSALMRKAMEQFLRRRERASLRQQIGEYFEVYGDRERALCEEFQHVDAENF